VFGKSSQRSIELAKKDFPETNKHQQIETQFVIKISNLFRLINISSKKRDFYEE